ncbi:MAG: cobyric acid synthase [Emergencia sp.]
MAKTIMVLGTCSNAGKSLLAAGLCRIFRQDGYKVAPFKAQNMALNSFITKDGFEMGRAQVMQAEACRIEPDCRMNPILLKPTSDEGSQVIINGEVKGNYSAHEFYACKDDFRTEVQKAFDSLSEEYDVIVLEGAGSPAEINLMENDLVNMGMAEMADAPVLLVGDIDRGGVFASLAGTMLLFSEEQKARVKGVIINKFRGDVTILQPGLDMLEDIIRVPVAGVVPYMQLDVDDEDSLTDRFAKRKGDALIDIAVIRVPRISNFTDFNPFEYIEGVDVRYVGSVHELGDPDLIILPGTKNTMSDLLWLRQSGMEAAILKYHSRNKPVFGICGGFQMLGQSLSDPAGVEHGGTMSGIGLLPHSTVFEDEKVRTNAIGVLSNVDGIFSGLSGKEYQGYEIHMGVSGADGNIINEGNVYGTYIHGIFDREEIARTVVQALLAAKGLDFSDVKAFDVDAYKQEQYDILADGLRASLDMDLIYRILNGEEQR